MTEIIRHCPDCGRGRVFAQHHGADGCCPDTADHSCPEWYCVTCGATLLIGEVPATAGASAGAAAAVAAEPVPAAGLRDRVA